jgi:hypothetical protein
MNSSCATLKRLCRKKYSCEDKKNAIKYLCSTVWQREGTLLYENPNKEPGTYSGLQLFELPANNKHEDENCNHYVGYSLQGVRDTTNDEILAAGGTFFSTNIDGYYWSRQSYAANWNEELGHFDCKLTDLDDKSNYTFTLGMNKPTKISWRGYETNAIAVNPGNLIDGDSGFSANGYYIALPNESPSNYPSYPQVYSLAGWGGTNKKGKEYFEAVLRTGPVVASEASDRSFSLSLNGLQRLELEPYYNEKQFNARLYVKYNTPTPVSNNDNAVQGMCSVFYHDGPSNTIKYIDGTYLTRYIATTRTSRTATRIICGDVSNPDLSVNIIIDTITGNQVIVNECQLPLVLFEDGISPKLITISDAAAIKLQLDETVGSSSADDIVHAQVRGRPEFYIIDSSNGNLTQGISSLLPNTYGTTSLSNEAIWTITVNKNNDSWQLN